MTTPSKDLGIEKQPDRFQPSFFRFPINNNRAGYQPYASPVILVVPFTFDLETGKQITGARPKSLRYSVQDAPDPAIVAGVENRGITVPDLDLFAIDITSTDLAGSKIDMSGLSYFRIDSDGNETAISFDDAKEGDFFEYTLETNVRGRTIYYPDAEYFDLSRFSIPTAELPDGRYNFVWEAVFNSRKSSEEGEFICMSDDEILTTHIINIACPGEIHSSMVGNTPSVYFSENSKIEDDSMVRAYRPLADALQDIFDEQNLLRKLSWVNEIPAQLIPYLAFLIGWDLPNFPGVNDNVRRSILRRGLALQKLKGSRLAIRELFEIFGFTVNIINTWFALGADDGSRVIAPNEELPNEIENQEIKTETPCHYEVLVADYDAVGFGGLSVPLLNRPISDITLHAYLVEDGSDSYSALQDIVNDLSSNLNVLDSILCSRTLDGFFVPSNISSRLPDEKIDGFGQVLIDIDDKIAIDDIKIGNSTISKPTVNFNRDTSTLGITFNGYQSFKSASGSGLKIFIFAQYIYNKIIVPEPLKDRRSNRFDIEILFKNGNAIPSNIYDYLLGFVTKLKAFQSLLRKIVFNSDHIEVYQVTDFCVGGDVKQRPGTDAGEIQTLPAVDPEDITDDNCISTSERGFTQETLDYRSVVLKGLEQEFDAYKNIDKSIPNSLRTQLESLSNVDINENSEDCGEVEHGQNRVLDSDINPDINDTRDTLCDLDDNALDYCYKSRVGNEIEANRIVSSDETWQFNACTSIMGIGSYYTIPIKSFKELGLNGNLGNLLDDWKDQSTLDQLYFNDRFGVDVDSLREQRAIRRPNLKIQHPFMHFPGHRFMAMSALEEDFTHPIYAARPWDNIYSDNVRNCKDPSASEQNILNTSIDTNSDGDEVLTFDLIPLVYIGNGLSPDISSLGSHDIKSFHVTHSIFSAAGEGILSDDGSPVVTFDTVVNTTSSSIGFGDSGDTKLFNSYNDDCDQDYIDGYPSEYGVFQLIAENGTTSNIVGAPSIDDPFGDSELGSSAPPEYIPPDCLLFKCGSGISVCLDKLSGHDNCGT